MQQISWKCLAVISIAMCSLVMAVPVPQNEETSFQNPSLDPANQGLISDLTPDERGKRGFGPDIGFGVKNAVLGYVFGDDGESDNGARVVRVTRATPVLPPGVTDDTPDFDREQVMLDIPDQLFGNSFTIVTNISKVFGDLMMNTARRYANFVQYFKPLLGKALTVKGLYPPPSTTTAVPITDSNDI